MATVGGERLLDNLICAIFSIIFTMRTTAMSGSGVRVVNGLMRATGAWTILLTDWLDREGLTAPQAACSTVKLSFARRRGAPPAWRGPGSRLRHYGQGCGTGLADRGRRCKTRVTWACWAIWWRHRDNLGEFMRVYLPYERLFMAPTSLR